MELVDTLALGASGAIRGGSSPLPPTRLYQTAQSIRGRGVPIGASLFVCPNALRICSRGLSPVARLVRVTNEIIYIVKITQTVDYAV